MDNLTHSLCGWALARTGMNRFGKWVTPFVILLANLPDLEPVLLPGHTRADYLFYHRGLTHSIFMLTIYALLFGTALWFLTRRSDSSGRPLPLWKAILICAAGSFSHLLLDWFNNFGVRPGLPFDATRFYGDIIFIVDPWVWLMFGIPILLGSKVNANWTAFWVVITTLATGVVCFGLSQGLIPWPVLLVWSIAIGVAIALRMRKRFDSETTARRGLLILATYLLLAFTTSHLALERAKSELEAAFPGAMRDVVRTSVAPHAAQPWLYDVMLQSDEVLSHVSINLLGKSFVDPERAQLNLRDPALNKVRSTFEYRAWMGFARHPYVLRRGNVLILGDARYRARGGDWTLLTVPIPAD